ncbi:MAG: hypothetical protein JXA30_18410 [Deltaproteobacteria bacterium]|nr:hypothetical protein [Deltaproteobacteria bacterium]
MLPREYRKTHFSSKADAEVRHGVTAIRAIRLVGVLFSLLVVSINSTVAFTARAETAAYRADGLAALVGGSIPGPRVDIILRSDVDLRARLRLCGQRNGALPLGPLPRSLLKASLAEIIGEYLIVREANRLQIRRPVAAKVADELRRIEQMAGGRERLHTLLRALAIRRDEIDEIARRRALVAAFLSLNLSDARMIADSQTERPFQNRDGSGMISDSSVAAGSPLARLTRSAIDQTVARWIKVLRARTPVYVFSD